MFILEKEVERAGGMRGAEGLAIGEHSNINFGESKVILCPTGEERLARINVEHDGPVSRL